MKNTFIIAGLLILVALAAWRLMNGEATRTIDYQGQKILLTKAYSDYDDYKNDPNNIDPSETAHVQALVREARIARQFKTKFEVSQAMSEIVFPGYGSGGIGGDAGMDSAVIGFSIEIPRAPDGRYLIFRKNADGYVLIDDFTDSTMPGINLVQQVGDTLVYSMEGRPERLIRPLAASSTK